MRFLSRGYILSSYFFLYGAQDYSATLTSMSRLWPYHHERPCSQRCEPLLQSCGAPAQYDLLVRVSILITCEYLELFLLSTSTNGANCPNERQNIEKTWVNAGPVCIYATTSRWADLRTRNNHNAPYWQCGLLAFIRLAVSAFFINSNHCM